MKVIFVACFVVGAYSVQAEPTPKDDLQPVEYQWLDDLHDDIAHSVKVSAQWFDDFFAHEDAGHNEHAKAQARIKLGWEPRSGDLTDIEARFKLRVQLPNLKNKVDLVFSDYDDDIPDEKVRAARNNQQVDQQDRFNLALRFRAKEHKGLSHRIGIGRKFQLFARSRYRKEINFTNNLDLRWEAAIYYYSRDRFGTSTAFTLDYQASNKSIYRFDNRFYFRDKQDNWLWQHSLQKFYQYDQGSAITYGLYFEGLSKPSYRFEKYLVSVKWRQSTVREWLFYEVEPFVLWERDEGFRPSYGIALRLEGYFGET